MKTKQFEPSVQFTTLAITDGERLIHCNSIGKPILKIYYPVRTSYYSYVGYFDLNTSLPSPTETYSQQEALVLLVYES